MANKKPIVIAGTVFLIIVLYLFLGGSGSHSQTQNQPMGNDSVMELRFNNKLDPKDRVISVEKSVLCLDVKSRNYVTEMSRFTSDVGTIYCWARIINGDGQKIRFIWQIGNNISPSPWLDVNSDKFRIWCPKYVDSKTSGEGTVDIVDGTGRLLKRLQFEVVRLKKPAYRSIRKL
ncbi:MAG: DUF2914 domain-containing protein [Planctomycetota bacterium]